MTERAEQLTTAAQSDWSINYLRRVSPRRVLTGALGILLVLGLVVVFANGNLEWSKTAQYLFDTRILNGVLYTIVYSVLAMVVGVVGGTVLAVAVMSANPVWRGLAHGYISLFRSLPLLILLLILYNIAIFLPRVSVGIPWTDAAYHVDVNSVVTPFLAAVLGLALHEAAYMAEIIRAGINGVSGGQTQAAESLGMTYGEGLRWVILPQAVRIIVPPTANQFISMLKNTSLVVVIAGHDLLTVTKELYSQNFLTMELLFVAAIWYLVMVLLFSLGSRQVERRFSRGF